MNTKTPLYEMLKLITLKNPSLTVGEAGVIFTNIKNALKEVQC